MRETNTISKSGSGNCNTVIRRPIQTILHIIAVFVFLTLATSGCSDTSITERFWVYPTDLRLSRGNRIAINFLLTKNATVSMSVHDQGGELVRFLIENEQRNGTELQTVTWDGTSSTGRMVNVGIYYLLLTVQEQRDTVPIVVLP